MFKKVVLLIIAGILSLLVSELIVGKIIGYPAYGVAYKVHYRNGAEPWTNIRKSRAKVFNVESKTIIPVNNYGLPGRDIENLDNPLALLGSSYVEALQYQPEVVASTILEDKLRKIDPTYDIVNLGCSGHDPYDSYFRLKYFEKKMHIKIEDVVLVLNSDNNFWFSRHPKPLSFQTGKDFGMIKSDLKTKLKILVKNNSSLLQLYVRGFFQATIQDDNNRDSQVSVPGEPVKKENSALALSPEMKDCLIAFKKDYDDFAVITITDNQSFNKQLLDFCEDEKIDAFATPIMKPEYMINGAGHLNEKGNRLLGEFIAQKYLDISELD